MADETETAIALVQDESAVGKLTTDVDRLATGLRAAAFEFDPDDYMTVGAAEDLKITDGEDYARGFALMTELSMIEDRIASHYSRFDKPLNFLVQVVRKLKKPQIDTVAPIKKALSLRLGAWKAAEDARLRLETQRAQEVADAAARAAQQTKADTLARIAQTESNPSLAESFTREAEMVRSVPIKAAPVEVKPSVPVVAGHTRETWKCEFDDVKELMRAYVEGRCFLDEQAIIDGLQSSLDTQAASLTTNLGRAFPGTRAVMVTAAVAPRRKR